MQGSILYASITLNAKISVKHGGRVNDRSKIDTQT